MRKSIFKNILTAIFIICYFMILSFAYTRMNMDRLVGDIEVFSGMFLIVGIIMIERAYKNDNGKAAITGIELLVLAFHSLSITHITNLLKYDFKLYLITSSCVIAIYYVLKLAIMYTKEKKKSLNELRDISEIVKQDEPIKKEAKKRKNKKKKERI